ncbi:MAG: methylated-DNA--[protein]-cysteine S-methyltransferase [Gammaproteobacteria bacterium]|nr:methylated-DNA--[protein]-cysteine S-methyltransferase [Gammaproteobacteria bacterium]
MEGLRLGVRIEDGAVVAFDFLLPGTAAYRVSYADGGLAQRCAEQLRQYFTESSFHFHLPLAPEGTVFQRRVWSELAAIPSGQVHSYGEIARRLGSSARAVGGACRSNPLPIVVPCHRVVAADGLGGYSGATAGRMHRIKRWLLAHEGYRDGDDRRVAATA